MENCANDQFRISSGMKYITLKFFHRYSQELIVGNTLADYTFGQKITFSNKS